MSTGFDDRDDLLEAYLAKSGASDLGEDTPARLWEDGRQVGEWAVTGFLARGGSAEVYCAKHRRLGTRAALKVLWREGNGPRARFEKETRFMMGNPGPSFPAFYGAGVDEGRPWVAMELLDECPIPRADDEVARYLLDVGRGVATLHARGWLHRDLKPRNILRRTDGHAVLADFGLLKAIGEDETTMGAGSPSIVDGREVGVGTPGWSAPEQFAGGGATPAADVYALGMLAEECLGGNPPRAWEKIIRRATAALPRLRYPGVAPMLRDIRRRHRSRHVAWVSLACVLVLAMVALGWWTLWKPKPHPIAGERTPLVQARPPKAPVGQALPATGPEVLETLSPEEEVVLPKVQEVLVDIQEPVVLEPVVVPNELPVQSPEAPIAQALPSTGPEVLETLSPEEEVVLPKVQEVLVDIQEPVVLEPVVVPNELPVALPVEQAASPAKSVTPVAKKPVNGIARRGILAERAAALARFEADEARKEVILELVDDMASFGSYRMGRHEVTQRQWMALMEDNPSLVKGDDLPVDSLTFGACLEFLKRLNATSIVQDDVWTYQLPTSGGWKNWVDSLSDQRAKGANPGGADLDGPIYDLTLTWVEEDGKTGFKCMGGWQTDGNSEGTNYVLLEQPALIHLHFQRFDHAAPSTDIVPSDYPHAVCPLPGKIGFRLWAEENPDIAIKAKARAEEALRSAIAHWENEGSD